MIEGLIKTAIDMRIKKEVETEIANARSNIAKKIPEIVAGVSIAVMKRISMQRLNDELMISVAMDCGCKSAPKKAEEQKDNGQKTEGLIRTAWEDSRD